MASGISSVEFLSPGHRADDQKGLGAVRHGIGQGCLRWFVGQILLAGEEADEGTATEGYVVADGSAQDGESGFEGIEDRAQRHWSVNLELNLAVHVRQCSQMYRERDSNHGKV